MPVRKVRLLSARLTGRSLVGMALQQWDSDESWYAIHELRARGCATMVDRCLRLSRSRNWRKRALAVDVLCQLAIPRTSRGGGFAPGEPFGVEQAHHVLLHALDDPHAAVVLAAIYECGHRRFAAAQRRLLEFVAHPSPDVRHAVAFALAPGSDETPESDAAIAALLQLMQDRDEDVRDWATFKIGEQSTRDTPAIREALWRNTSDPHVDVRGEAMVGLARRRDHRLFSLLPRLLEDDQWRGWVHNITEDFADDGLWQALVSFAASFQGSVAARAVLDRMVAEAESLRNAPH
ncbi:HEAT repeat domain-containing protein [Tahibacter amnicola]|uniref:HEAT repeat domain-containing protein n=1 Tax=Tahibacter amnicola TaxID=2976241 RepID=A0ABY6BJM1_9GAMM|nr:HEAT repeat domain-containing protein [Tahibacter amnicola]UXI70208.1 HEAT repeat domain-containing protein [Tahibacter amnicola]